MEILKKILLLLPLLIFSNCADETNTVVIKLRTDTFISSSSNEVNTDKDYLSLAKGNGVENRILLKLPSVEKDEDDFFSDCWDLTGACNVFLIPANIISRILSYCEGSVLDSSSLTSAVLVFNTNDGTSISAGELNISLLSKPWWQTANWEIAHPFSSNGIWDSPGGDLDSSVSFDTNCNNLSSGSCASGEIKFEMTSYFRTLLNNLGNTHYGMMIYPNVDLSESRIYSVQANSEFSPRIVATYTGNCSTSLVGEDALGVSGDKVMTKVFYLGDEI